MSTQEDIQSIVNPQEQEELKTETNHLLEECLESTKRMVALCLDTEDIGCKTCNLLSEQGEQLTRIESDADVMAEELSTAARRLERMGKWCDLCSCFRKARRATKPESNESLWKREDSGDWVVARQPPVCHQEQEPTHETTHFCNITGDPKEVQMEDNISQVSIALNTLRNMAVHMGEELEVHNVKIERIAEKTDSNTSKIKATEKRVKKLLS